MRAYVLANYAGKLLLVEERDEAHLAPTDKLTSLDVIIRVRTNKVVNLAVLLHKISEPL